MTRWSFRVSTFEAYAAHEAPDTPVAIWIDAHRGEVFGAVYGADGVVLAPGAALRPEAALDAWEHIVAAHPSIRFAGDGALRYAGTIRARFGERPQLPTGIPALAGTIGQLASRFPDRAVRPHAVMPVYLRRSDAEVTRERRLAPKAP